MTSKTKQFSRVRFTPEVITKASEAFAALVAARAPRGVAPGQVEYQWMRVTKGATSWKFDSMHEFMAELRTQHNYAHCEIRWSETWASDRALIVTHHEEFATVEVSFDDRGPVEQVMGIFDDAAPALRLPVQPMPPAPKPVIFIGHGRSDLWKDLKNHLQDKQRYDVEAYETGARGGHTIRDILEDMLKASSFALILMTAEDEQADGALRARQNVVHEAGLFQGRLGFPRAVVLLEDGVESFSNIDGVQYIPFSKGNIRETFGDVVATIKREFPS
ncbi:TIR domain-containing protein [Cellulomonas sp. P22]|uniref:TIR domain-containing protein n=1 Tax=Cellulomonas sp. P22 TaxID=3373189 RepID=UPI0037912CAB